MDNETITIDSQITDSIDSDDIEQFRKLLDKYREDYNKVSAMAYAILYDKLEFVVELINQKVEIDPKIISLIKEKKKGLCYDYFTHRKYI